MFNVFMDENVFRASFDRMGEFLRYETDRPFHASGHRFYGSRPYSRGFLPQQDESSTASSFGFVKGFHTLEDGSDPSVGVLSTLDYLLLILLTPHWGLSLAIYMLNGT